MAEFFYTVKFQAGTDLILEDQDEFEQYASINSVQFDEEGAASFKGIPINGFTREDPEPEVADTQGNTTIDASAQDTPLEQIVYMASMKLTVGCIL